MKKEAKDFWNWFQLNNRQYLFVNQVSQAEKERMLDALQEQLHVFCDALWFEIGGHPDEDQELIITAAGDTAYFSKVIEIVELAPKVKNWSFVAFKPPREIDFVIECEEVKLFPAEIWFLPLSHSQFPASLGLRICLPNYMEVNNSEWLTAAVFEMLDTVLGEQSFALDIDHVEIESLPKNPEEQGLMELRELLDYVNWHKAQFAE